MADLSSPAAVDEEVNDTTKEDAGIKGVGKPERARAELREKNIHSQILRLNNEFGILSCPDGDTLAYIGPYPQTLSESHTWDHEYNQNHFSVPHRVHSSKFLALNSKKFNYLLGPRSIRTERCFRKEGLLSRVSTKGIKYFVDLRPPTEDEEAVVLLTSLTCTRGVLTWQTARNKYGLSPLLVEGQDDSSSIPVDFHLLADLPEPKEVSKCQNATLSTKSSRAEQKPCDDEQPGGWEAPHDEGLTTSKKEEKDVEMQNGPASSPKLPATEGVPLESPSPKPTSPKVSSTQPTTTPSKQPEKPLAILPEYSPLRHRSGIERLVHAIENGDPKLDSAPKIWTFFALAKYFDCASHERISGWITRWLLSYPNSNFIQSNPEVALRIGLGTQSEVLTKDAFSILVGEKSLMNVFGESDPAILSPLVQSVHGRKLELLDDDERNRIDHAAASLVRRVRQRFDDLVGGEMAWLHQSFSYRKITSLVPSNPEEADVVQRLVQKLQQFVRGRIIWVLGRSHDHDFADFEQALTTVRTFYPGTRESFRKTYHTLNEGERIFTRFFWVALHREALGDGAVNLWTEFPGKSDPPQTGSTPLSQKMLDRSMPSGERLCQIVSRNEVDALITRFNQIGRSRRAAEMQTPTQAVCPTVPVGPAKPDLHSRPVHDAKKGRRESLSARALLGSIGIKNLYDTSPKREQSLTPSTLTTEKRRKLSDADVGSVELAANPFAFEYLPIRSRGTTFSERDGEILPSRDNPAPMNSLEPPVESIELAPPCNGPIDLEAGMPDVVSQSSALSQSPISHSKTPSGPYTFGHDDSRVQSFRPILPKIPDSGLSMKDASYRQRIADVSSGPNHLSDSHDNQAPAVMSDGYGADFDGNHPGRPTTTVDYSSRVHDSTSGRVVTAADWDFQDDDVDWSAPVVKQQFSDYHDTQPVQPPPDCLSSSQLLRDISIVLHRICDEIINPTHLFHSDNVLPTNLIDTLMCLSEDEWKYLPLWAGGNDDGSGGVFDEVDVPNLEAGGFRGGKRGIGSVRNSGASSSVSESSFDDIGSDAISTVGKASKAATDGTQTVKSLSDIGSEEEGFMRQNELWDEIRNMKIGGARSLGQGSSEAPADDLDDGFDDGHDDDDDDDDDDMDDQDADDVDTVVGAGSIDGDDDDMDAEDGPGVSALNDEGMDDHDVEIISATDL